MKIAVIGPQFPDSFANNVTTTLETMGHEVLKLDGRLQRHNSGRYEAAARRLLPKILPLIETKMHAGLLAKIKHFRPALVVVTYDLFTPELVDRVKRTAQAPTICWYIDAPANLRGGNLFLCDYDAFFLKEPRLVDTMQSKLKLPAHLLAEACNPLWHKPVTPSPAQLVKYGCEVVAQGTAHPYRMKFFEGLLDFDVKIWGSAVPARMESPAKRFFQGHYIAGEEKSIAFACGRILVNSMNFAEADGVNNTLFEGAGCGVFQICDERPTLSEFFKVDEEIVTFRNRGELVEKIRYYLTHDAERKKIGKQASARAHSEHTYEKRLSEMLRITKLG